MVTTQVGFGASGRNYLLLSNTLEKRGFIDWKDSGGRAEQLNLQVEQELGQRWDPGSGGAASSLWHVLESVPSASADLAGATFGLASFCLALVPGFSLPPGLLCSPPKGSSRFCVPSPSVCSQ